MNNTIHAALAQIDAALVKLRAELGPPQVVDPSTGYDVLSLPVNLNSLGFSCRVLNTFDRERIHTIGDIVKWSERGLCALRGFGKGSMREVQEVLGRYNLHVDYWEPR